MENLPVLCLEKVFDYLQNLNEPNRCSSTCKKWKDASRLFEPTTVSVHRSLPADLPMFQPHQRKIHQLELVLGPLVRRVIISTTFSTQRSIKNKRLDFIS